MKINQQRERKTDKNNKNTQKITKMKRTFESGWKSAKD